MRPSPRNLLLLLALLAYAANTLAAEDAVLTFTIKGSEPKQISLTELNLRLQAHEISYDDPHYKKRKRLRAFALKDVLKLGFGSAWRSGEFSDALFRAKDGYTAVAKRHMLNERGGYLAFADAERDGWEPVGRKQANPGPFYLVWTKAKQSTKNGYPWPWQLASIELVGYCDTKPSICPDAVSATDAERKGFETFKSRCARCHAISGQGGQLGPDLNAPMNITEYRSEIMLKAFIREPSKYRHTHMPDHKDLSDAQLDELVAYLRHMKGRD